MIKSKVSYKIVKATKKDEGWIKQIYKVNKKHLGSFNLFQSWDHYIEKEKGSFSVIRDKGFVRHSWMKKYAANVVHDIGVAEEHQGKGIALALMKSVPLPILLKCNQDNEKGNAFYKAIGMIKAGTTATKKGVPQNIWILNRW